MLVSERVRDSVAIERIAINEADVSQKDAVGRRPRGKQIAAAGDPGYWTTLPYRELAETLSAARFPAAPSHSAGTALANYACYRMMHALAQRGGSVRAGLLQLPFAGPAFSEAAATRFLSALLGALDPSLLAEDRLGIDLSGLEDRLRTGSLLR